jgi:hypothetical protein
MPAGSDIRIEKKPLYWPGEIIACKRGEDQIVSHRMLGYLRGRRGWSVLTRADNAALADLPVALDNVLGRVTHVNGDPFRPRLTDRLAAQVAWLPAMIQAVLNRSSNSATVLSKA